LVESPYELAEGADALVVCTEWNEFKQVDFARLKESMKQPIIVDGRNIYEPEIMQDLGFIYRGVGRGAEYNNNGNGTTNSNADSATTAPVTSSVASTSNGNGH
jgi:UDPglucose 6-dehydrogenase